MWVNCKDCEYIIVLDESPSRCSPPGLLLPTAWDAHIEANPPIVPYNHKCAIFRLKDYESE